MRIQHNIAAMNSYRNYGNNVKAVNGNLEKLSSGYKINRAGDDAAGLAISEKMRAQITGLNAAQKNVKDGISLVKTAEGAMQEIQDMLNRMDYLATQSANGTYDEGVDRANLQKEVQSLKSEIDRIADSSNFNGIKLLDGTQSGGGVTFVQMEANDDGTVATQASVTVKIDASGEDFIGGTIQIGNDSFSIKEADGNNAAGDIVNGVLYVNKASTNEEIAGWIAGEVSEITLKDVNGNEISASGTQDGNTIVYETNETSYAQIDVASQPQITLNGGLRLQIGDTARSYNQIRVGISDTHVAELGLTAIDISTQDGAADAVDYIRHAINKVSSTRGDLGAIQNRLDHTANNLSVMTENIQDAESTIRDTDVAEEMMSYTKNNILIQSAQAMLAQANQIPQGVLQLLG